MKFSLFNIYVILLIIWFVYNFIKKRKAIIERQKRAREEYQRNENTDSSESEDDVLRKLKNMVEWTGKDNNESEEKKLMRDILGTGGYEDEDEDEEYEEYEDEYIETSSTTSSEPAYKREVENNSMSRITAEQKSILEKQKIFEEFAKKSSINNSSIRSKAHDDDSTYDYNINKRNAVSVFKASHEDLRNAIVYKAILDRRGKKIR